LPACRRWLMCVFFRFHGPSCTTPKVPKTVLPPNVFEKMFFRPEPQFEAH
jgi:hypothetical protein